MAARAAGVVGAVAASVDVGATDVDTATRMRRVVTARRLWWPATGEGMVRLMPTLLSRRRATPRMRQWRTASRHRLRATAPPPPPGYAPHGYGYVPQGYVMPQAYVPPAHAGYSGYGFDGGGGHAGTEVLPQQPSMAGQPAGSEGAYGGAANSTSYFSQPPGAAAAVRPAPNAAWYGQTGAYAMQQPGMQLPGVSGGHGPIGSGPYMQQQQQQLQRQPPQQQHGCVSWIWLP